MKAHTKGIIRAVAVAAIVVGCAAGGPGSAPADAQGKAPKPCPGASCDVIVTVTGDAQPVVAVDANELKMGRGNRNTMISWKLLTPGYEFRQDSITPYTGAATPTKQATTSGAWDAQISYENNTATTFRVKNRNTTGGSLYYNVKVYRKSNGTPVQLDPVIINDP